MDDARTEIADLVNNWALFRDQEKWDALSGTFHEGGTISLSWFDGPHEGFIAASRQLAARGGALLKHHIGVPRIRISGDRALSEVNVTIMVRAKTPAGEVDTTSYARFIDRIEKRDGTWRIVKRVAVYEKDRADPVDRASLPDGFFDGLEKFPAELKFLAASLDKAGIPLSPATVLDKSPELAALHAEGDAWLAGN
ncbi:nuclear transport factor 2 family protein [Parvibaculum sp.]|uniref:nuclear transport factor 2 family protein n=1 Tax=Parvibaculum sp. TaxID=2024848 RepID=UPI001E0228CD|nr:nuclear transport factor 2 family protein [Parvibaculum sp.]MBX3488563.1 nuclear transport factor 2 family protein [Parvibaculum sp.]MCW5727509.1 nuclear transport factor 2 family protein [Parvibaculum sp.]